MSRVSCAQLAYENGKAEIQARRPIARAHQAGEALLGGKASPAAVFSSVGRGQRR